MRAKPGDFCILVEPYAKDRRHIYRRIAQLYKAAARLGLRVLDHREMTANGWNTGRPQPNPDCSACTTCAPAE